MNLIFLANQIKMLDKYFKTIIWVFCSQCLKKIQKNCIPSHVYKIIANGYYNSDIAFIKPLKRKIV